MGAAANAVRPKDSPPNSSARFGTGLAVRAAMQPATRALPGRGGHYEVRAHTGAQLRRSVANQNSFSRTVARPPSTV